MIASKSEVNRLKSQAKDSTLTFAKQAAIFLEKGAKRKKKPMRPATLETYKSQITTHLLPLLGPMPLEAVGNKLVKAVIEELQEQKLSPATINLNLNIIKQIVASATNEDGDRLFPRDWNSEHIDAPAIEDQKRPKTTPEAIAEAIFKAERFDRALYAILAGSGCRIAEALALMVQDSGSNTYWDRVNGKLIIRQQRNGQVFGLPKTKAGNREIDLSPELNTFLELTLMPNDINGLIFPESEATYRIRLEQNGVSGGFHAFRRFRATHIDGMGVPDGLQRFWCGHASKDVHQGYISSGEKIQLRKEWAIKAGLGFKLEAA